MCLGRNSCDLVANPEEHRLIGIQATELIQQSETSAPKVECRSQVAERRQPFKAVVFVDADHGSRILPAYPKSRPVRNWSADVWVHLPLMYWQ